MMKNVVAKLSAEVIEPLERLEAKLSGQPELVAKWFEENWQQTRSPFYCSVDLRNAGFKLAPIDTNLFPAGFNNLNEASVQLGAKAAKSMMRRLGAETKEILIIPESHTRNVMYFENLAALQQILTGAGLTVKIGSLLEQLTSKKTVELPSGRSVTLEPIERKDKRLFIGDFSPAFVLLNNDFSEGTPENLQGLEQRFLPPMGLGWAHRLKSGHFQHYQNVADEFSKLIGCDPWLITPAFRYCGEIDFLTREGEDCLTRHADTVLKTIRMKYDEYGIKQAPYVVIKSDSGTYGMSVMTIKNSDEIRHLNRKQRTKMAVAKGGHAVSKVIIQEGVYTFETVGDGVAEPVIYMMGGEVLGGFYRVHNARGPDENLNAAGMNFQPLAFCDECKKPGHRCYTYSVVARLALLAAARELDEKGEQI